MALSIGSVDEVYGVDFSGSQRAGRKIWVAGGSVEDGALAVSTCEPAKDLDGGGVKRTAALSALRTFVEDGKSAAAFGFDFPFGLPAAAVDGGAFERWTDFVEGFDGTYDDADDMRDQCIAEADGNALRDTDAVHGGWSPYHWMLFRQTYHGISGVLAELVENGATVLPMQSADPDGDPWLLEVYPAATLARTDLYVGGYKGAAGTRDRRCENVERLREREGVSVEDDVRDAVVGDGAGDAHDAVIAAWAAYRALDDGVDGPEPPNELEGHIYA